MKLKDIMSQNVIKIHPQESVAVAARLLANHNIGVLPVCGSDGKLCGVVTDRDLVTRCMATNRSPEQTRVQDVTIHLVHDLPLFPIELGREPDPVGVMEITLVLLIHSG